MVLLFILSSNITFAAKDGWSGREWRKYVENGNGQSIIEESCRKMRELPDMIQGQPLDFDDGQTIMDYLITAETKTKEEDEELKQLMDAFMNADENGKTDRRWINKVSIDGNNSAAEELEADYQVLNERIENNSNYSQGEEGKKEDSKENNTEENKDDSKEDSNKEDKIDWKLLKTEDIANIGDAARAQEIYDMLLNAYVDYEENEEVINDYVKKLIALKNSQGYKSLLAMENPYYTEKSIEEKLRNIAFNDAEMLDSDTLASISDKDGGNVNLDVDNTGAPLLHIYKQPNRTSAERNTTRGDGLDKIITFANIFVKLGENEKIDSTELQKTFSWIYNIFLQVGVGISVIIGLVLAIKFILAGIEEKAEVKKMLGVYVISCVVIFGSFGIWKLVLNILVTI